MEGDQPRRSSRINKGQPPHRFQDYERDMDLLNLFDTESSPRVRSPSKLLTNQQPPDDVRSEKSYQSRVSQRSSASHDRKRRQLLELQHLQEVMEYENKQEDLKIQAAANKLERERKVADLKYQIEKDRIDEDEEYGDAGSQCSLYSSEKDVCPNVKPVFINRDSKPFFPLHSTTRDDVPFTNIQPPPVSRDNQQSRVISPIHAWVNQPSASSLSSSPPPVLSETREIIKEIGLTMAEGISAAIKAVNSSTTTNYGSRFRKVPDLPVYSGEQQEWPLFFADFKQSTEQWGITHVENVTRLRKALKGKAKEAVIAQMIHPDQLDDIINTLETRFGRPLAIIEEFMGKLIKYKKLTEGNFEEFIEFSSHVRNFLSIVTSFEKQNYLNNPCLVRDLTKKLPNTYLIKWAEVNSDKENLQVFSDWLKTQSKILTEVSFTQTHTIKENLKDFKKDKNKLQSKKDTRGVFHAKEEKPEERTEAPKQGTSGTHQSKTKTCPTCSKNHYLRDCPEFKKLTLEERKKGANEQRVCYGCTVKGHGIKDCKSKRRCPICHASVHALLHDCDHVKPKPKEVQPCDGQVNLVEKEIAYSVVPVIVKGKAKEVSTHALLDMGSTLSMIDSELALELGLKGTSKPLRFNTLSGPTGFPESQEVSLVLKNIYNGKEFKLNTVRTHNNLNVSGGTLTESEIKKFTHLSGIKLPAYHNCKPKLLLGLPDADLICPLRITETKRDQPVAAETKLGWTVFGRFTPPKDIEVVPSVNHVISLEPPESTLAQLHRKVEDFFSTEEFGVRVCPRDPMTALEKKALGIAQESLRRTEDGSRYELGLLWSEDNPKLPESYDMAFRRLKNVENKMDKNEVYSKRYLQNFQHYVDSGYLKKLTPEEAKQTSDKTWYLPHFGVINPQKPEKLRMVFDAAAVSSGVSLNSKLLPGPDILTPLPEVLAQFREEPVAWVGDIKEMFHNVRITKEDQDSQRILFRGMDRNREPDIYVLTVMSFGATCSPFCAQFVKNQHAQEFSESCPEASTIIQKKFYVDDGLASFTNSQLAYDRYLEVTKILGSGGFPLCNMASNSHQFIKSIPAELRSKSQKEFHGKELLAPEKILGLMWDPEKDVFQFNTSFPKTDPAIVTGKVNPTKREALALIMSVYDPMGFVANLTVKAKILIQKAWRLGVGWDENLPESLFENWKVWLQELHGVNHYTIRRCYSQDLSKSDNVQLHVFCDASEQAFAAVAYFVINQKETAFIEAKTRVCPLKSPITIPRAELQAAVLGTRLAESIRKRHKIQPHRRIFWTDNTTVLDWIRMDGGQLKQFVANRVGEIQQGTEVSEWRYIPTRDNVADEATRDSFSIDWSPNSRWALGPDFLLQEETLWPVEPKDRESSPEMTKEFRKDFVGVTNKGPECELLFDYLRYSTKSRLLRTTAFVFRYLFNLRNRQNPRTGPLTGKEILKAEVYHWKVSQHQDFGSLISVLVHGTEQKKQQTLKVKKMYKLSPYVDDQGILRMKSRIQHSIANLVNNPVILDSRHPYTELIIREAHNKFGHQLLQLTTNYLKAKYAIVGLREAVRRCSRNCQKCKNDRSQPVVPEMAPLPKERLDSYCYPFTNCGVDYFGPVMVKHGRRHEKKYGALFTCLTTRAVHIELAGDLSTDSFIMAFRRFSSRRGIPKKMMSDNGTNFHGAETELKEALKSLNQEQIHNEMTTKGIEWEFIPPHSPHMGGSWERLVRSIKSSLYAVLKEKYPTEETLSTLLTEAEATVNSHPLNYVSADPAEEEVLTPNHFLLLRPFNCDPPGKFDDKDLLLRKQWRIAQRMADHFWTKWTKEFLPTLQQRQKWHDKVPPLKVGDVVIIVDDLQPRNKWPRGIVEEIPLTSDGQTRWATVKTQYGVFKRPTAKLCILNIQNNESPSKQ